MQGKVPGPVLLEVRGVSLSFGGVHALHDVTSRSGEREVCALIGPNGAGNELLLNVINGVYAPRAGHDHASRARPGGACTRTRRRRGIARTFQNIALFRGMTVLDNVMAGRALNIARAASSSRRCTGPRAPARGDPAPRTGSSR